MGKPVKIDGKLYDIPDAERVFRPWTAEERADRMASHRLGFRQRQTLGSSFWWHPLVPGIAFPTRIAALRRALATNAGCEECGQ